ncbi:hypothetical protein [Enterovibrio coralii]|nr:hypothetical protein [Enterovibrio coralii]
MTEQDGVRLPGEKRLMRREQVLSDGLELMDSLYEELIDLANS